MISVITGDIIDSRTLKDQRAWIQPIKKLFNELGPSPKYWEIYRGDSFQLEILQPQEALLSAIRIKAIVKSIKNINIRMAIGIGKKDYEAKKITESNGEAFVFSGNTFEKLHVKRVSLALKTPWDTFDEEMNLYLQLLLIIMDSWTTVVAEIMNIILKEPKLKQKELTKRLGIKQSSVSYRIKKAHFGEIMKVDAIYRKKLMNFLK